MRFTTLALASVAVAIPFAAANAQQSPQGYGPPPGYEQGPPPGYEQGPPPSDQQGPPPGYEQGPPSGYQQGPDQADGQRPHAGHLLSAEQRMMMHQELSGQVSGMSSDQRRAFISGKMQELAAMSPEQRAKMRGELQARFEALPQQEQQQIEQRIAERRAEHHGGGGYDQQQYGPPQGAPQQYGSQGPQGAQQYGPPPGPRDNGDDDNE